MPGDHTRKRRRRVRPASRAGLGVLLGLAASLTFATSGTFLRPLFDAGWSPGAAVLWRVTCAALLMLPLGLWVMRGRVRAVLAEWRIILGFGALAVATAQLMYFAAVSRMSVSIALLIEYMAPVLLVLVAWARTRHAPSRLVLAGTAASVLGLVCVLDLTGARPDALGVVPCQTANELVPEKGLESERAPVSTPSRFAYNRS